MPNALHLTVAALVPGKQGFLMVREEDSGRTVFNQPAGHVEAGESFNEAVIRETFEETGWHVKPRHLLGMSTYTSPHNHITYYRVAFLCDALSHDHDAVLDKDIIEALWLSEEQLRARQDQMRSPMVLHTLDDYLAGVRYPLEIIRDYR